MHLMKTIVTAPLFFLVSSTAFSQLTKNAYVERDPRLDLMVEKHAELNREALKPKYKIEPGFRLLMISTNKRDAALEMRSRLLKLYPDQKSYMYYQSPFFKIQFGNFKTSKEAEEFKTQMINAFGESILIIPAQVEVKLEIEQTQ